VGVPSRGAECLEAVGLGQSAEPLPALRPHFWALRPRSLRVGLRSSGTPGAPVADDGQSSVGGRHQTKGAGSRAARGSKLLSSFLA
jgi:hypothetical protein